MLRSMTGYGRAQSTGAGFDVTVELKSVNHRYFECAVKLPKAFLFLEDGLKKQVQASVSRGKMELQLTMTAENGSDTEISIDEAAACKYVTALRMTGSKLGLQDDLKISQLLEIPELFTVKRAEMDEEAVTAVVAETAAKAIESFQQMSLAEGEKLREDLQGKLNGIENLVAQVEKCAPERQKAYYDRLYARLKEVLEDSNVEESRLVAEAAIFADKVAVDEETVRLRSHLHQFRGMLDADEPVGKKLDFLVQEMNRETNTIGSKAQDVRVSKIVVELKSEIEKIREQIQNIE